jgi:hypothetical protein
VPEISWLVHVTLTNLKLSIKKQEPHAFETIPACETARKVQAEHLFAGKGA